MPRRRSASLDPSQVLASSRRVADNPTRPEIVATVDPSTMPLRDVDMIRLDAASHPLHVLGELRRRYPCPALLDLPGPHRRRANSMLTNSELLVFASAERFHWVGLNGVNGARQVEQARRMLHPSIRLMIGVDSPSVIERHLEELAHLGDALVLDLKELERNAGVARVWSNIEHGLTTARETSRPLFLRGNLLPSMVKIPNPAKVELEAMWRLAELGCGGFVLDDETRRGLYPQECVDVLRMLGSRRARLRQPRASAKLGGKPSVILEDPGPK